MSGKSPRGHISRLPPATTDEWDWQMEGLCRGMKSEAFFHPDGEKGQARHLRDERAKAICQACPVLEQCRKHALEVQEPYGVWGGMTESERSEILKGKRRRR